ncbi:MAG: extracellular solute-binding protein [Clostridiales bacterium]|jgi:putative aldouronate transport system substrate-binding protein|nr:extracellular solute-binding protein [Clostridiales bacterium]
MPFNHKRFASLTSLAMAIIMALAACGNSSGSANSGNAGSDSPAASASSGSSAAETAKEAVPPLSPDNPREFSVLFNYSWFPADNFNGVIPEEITKRLGVTLKPSVVIDNQQLGTLIASGDLPDIIATSDLRSNLSSSELCYDLGGIIEQYGLDPNLIPKMHQASAMSFSQDEGKYYAVLSHFDSTEDWRTLENYNLGAPTIGSLLYRHDLYEQMGSPKMETMDDVINMLLMAKDAFPELTTAVFIPFSTYFEYIRCNLGMGNLGCTFVESASGDWIPYVKHENYKQYMQYIYKLFSAGCIPADNWAWDISTSASMLSQGQAFAAFSGCQGNALAAQIELQRDVDPNAYVYEAPVVGDPDGYYMSDLGFMSTFITKNCKDPAGALQFLAWTLTDEGKKLTQWGREGHEYTLDENGNPTFSKEWNDAYLENTYQEIYNPFFYFGASRVFEAVSRCQDIDEATTPNYPVIRAHFANKPWMSYAIPVEGSDESIIYNNLFANPSGLFFTTEIKMATASSEEEFESIYNSMFEEAEKMGLSTIEAYMKDKINEAKAIYGA